MNFYILRENDRKTEKERALTRYISGHPRLFSEGNTPTCPVCHDYVDDKIWVPSYHIELEMLTKQFGNVLYGGSNILVDEYFKSCFEKTDLTGLEILGQAVINKIICRLGVKKKQLSEPPQYYVARIKYGCAAIDHQKSGTVFEEGKKPTCDYCRLGLLRRYPKIVIDESTWDGTDIFLARGIGSMKTTSQRFKDWWDSCNFNNCKLIPVEEEQCDFDTPIMVKKTQNPD